MIISLIVAAAENSVIGKDNKLIWNLPNDLKLFKRLTMGHHMIMGRKTFESIGKPLPGRTTVIVTRNRDYKMEGCLIAHSLEEALKFTKDNNETEVFIIGGSELFNQSIDLADRLYLTEVKATLDGDSFFHFNENKWKEEKREAHKADEKHLYDYDFVELKKIR